MSLSRVFSLSGLPLGTVAALALALLRPPVALAYEVPAYEGPVNDYAEVLSEDYEVQLEYELTQIAAEETGVEFAVVTIPGLQGESIEAVSQDFFDSWGIGKAGTDTGFLFLAAIDDREMRIHTGYGLEGQIPDSVAGRIIRDDIAPEFSQGSYEEGVKQMLRSVMDRLRNPEKYERLAAEQERANQFIFAAIGLAGLSILFVVVLYAAAFLARSQSWWLGGVIGFILGLLTGQILVSVILMLLGLSFDYLLSSNYQDLKKRYQRSKKKGEKQNPWLTFGGLLLDEPKWLKGGHNWTSGSGRSSGSSFSFSGGMSGGGGASGSW